MTLFVAGAFFLAAGLAGFPLWSGLIGVPVAVGYRRWAWRRAELFPITGETAKTARRAGWVVNIVAILGIFWP